MNSERILVWDLPTRLFHWLLAASFAGAWLTAESERWRDVHVVLGYGFAGLIVFRLLWGFVGTRYARFSAFITGPGPVKRYLGSILAGRPEHHVGHNPAGGWAVLALLGLGLASALSGFATYNGFGGHWLEELHEGAASAMLALVLVHIGAVVLSSLIHRENLVRAMLTGFKRHKRTTTRPRCASW
jgi:cytochrome b